MVRKLVLAASTVVVAAVMVVGPAGAHPVGDSSEPNCHGQRISHGSSDHGLTPKERAEMASELFGEDISVREMQEFVRMCLPPPPM